MKKNEMICDCTVVHPDVVSAVKNEMLSEKIYQDTAVFFKLLGDTSRVKLLAAMDNKEICVCDLACILNMTKSAVSHQLATLRNAGFVKYRRDGKTVFYSLADAHIQDIMRDGLHHTQE